MENTIDSIFTDVLNDDSLLSWLQTQAVDVWAPTISAHEGDIKAKETLALIDEKVQGEVREKLIWLKKIIEFFKLSFQFLFTSSIIFAVLLVTSNYSAYYTIVNNYVYPEQMEKSNISIMNSVNATALENKKDVDSRTNIATDESIIGSQHSIKQLIAKSNKSDTPLDIQITPFENRLVIPKIGKNIPMVEVTKKRVADINELQDVFMQELEKWVVRYPGSAKPGTEGTTFIFWHSSNFPWVPGDYNNVFALLDKVVYDDPIIVYFDQKKYVYKIREKQVIHPGDVAVLKRNKKVNEITLMTCWPVGTTLKRLVITGELVEGGEIIAQKNEQVAMK